MENLDGSIVEVDVGGRWRLRPITQSLMASPLLDKELLSTRAKLDCHATID
jgi:hypothetical protein